MKRRKLTPAERRQIYDKMAGRCAYCGCEISIKNMQVDHIKPVSRGGGDDADNLFPACRSCNHRKGTSSLEHFRHEVEQFPVVLMRHNVTYRNAVRFGLVEHKPGKVAFYFEKAGDNTCQKEN